MNKYIVNKILIGAALLGSVALTGCNDDDDLGSPDRLFRPIASASANGTSVTVSFTVTDGVEGYVLEFCKNNKFESDVLSFDFLVSELTVKGSTGSYTVDGLDYDTNYYARIKSYSSKLESDYYWGYQHGDLPTYWTITTDDYPTKLTSPISDDIVDVSARVRWTVDTTPYDSLAVTTEVKDTIDDIITVSDSLVNYVLLSEEDYNKGEVIIGQLKASKTYKVKAYANNVYMGKRTYKTVASQSFEGSVFDLRGLDAETALTVLTNDTIAQLADSTTVLLEGGMTYKLPTITLDKNISFVTGLSLNGKAIIAVDANFDVAADAEIDYITFKNLLFTEGIDKTKDQANYGGCYLFNFSFANSHVKDFVIDGCEIRYKRGVIRIKTAGITVDNMTLNDCQVDSIGGYGIINQDAACTVSNIILTNSTFSHCQKLLVNTKGNANETVTVEDNTFYSSPNGGQYFFDFNGKAVGSININRNIFGLAYGACNGMRSASTQVNMDKNYVTSDLEWVVDEATLLPKAAFDFDKLGSCAEVFADAENFDFTLQVEDVKSGDPRWY